MKKHTLVILLISFHCACMNSIEKEKSGILFGQNFDSTGAVSVQQLVQFINNETDTFCQVKGKIAEVCNKDGCWITLENTVGSPVLVTMKNQGFTVPKDIAGRLVYVNGFASVDTINVQLLRQYAFEAGKSEAEIQAIIKPQSEVVLDATGIIMISRNESSNKNN